MPPIATIRPVGFLALILAATGTVLRPQPQNQPINELQMTISRNDASASAEKDSTLAVKFKNLTFDKVMLVPGMLLDCGTAPAKFSFIRLNLRDPEGKEHRHLVYLGDGPPYVGGCGGGTATYKVVSHPRECVSLPLDIGKYLDLSDAQQYGEYRFPAGEYSLQAELPTAASVTQLLAGYKYENGVIKSNVLQIRFDHEFAAPVGDHPPH